MPEDNEIKIVPPKPKTTRRSPAPKRLNYVPWLVVLIATYFVMLLLGAYLPLPGYMQVLSLILGAFILCDIHHSIKYHVKNREQQ